MIFDAVLITSDQVAAAIERKSTQDMANINRYLGLICELFQCSNQIGLDQYNRHLSHYLIELAKLLNMNNGNWSKQIDLLHYPGDTDINEETIQPLLDDIFTAAQTFAEKNHQQLAISQTPQFRNPCVESKD